MKLKLQTRRLCLALAAAAVLAGGWLAIQAAPKPQMPGMFSVPER